MSDSHSPRYDNAIAGIESGGNYGLLGPVTKSGDRAYGKYQVMSGNIGPWTQEALGQSLTPDQFLANPQAQDAVFNYKFGQYVNKYGPEGAAKAWFAGEKGMNNPNAKDVLGTSVAGYGAKFMRNLAGQPTAQPPLQIAPQVAMQPSLQSAPMMPSGVQGGQAAQGAPMPQSSSFDFIPPPLQVPPINYYQRRNLAQLQAPLRGFSFKG